ncbi:hypothetical protein AAK967_04105 [Atopobiaceae bacterium 24-176]
MGIRHRIDRLSDAALAWAGAALLVAGAALSLVADPLFGTAAVVCGCLGGLACGVSAGRALAHKALLLSPSQAVPLEPAQHDGPSQAKPACSSIDLDSLAAALAQADEPVVALTGLVEDVRLRQGAAEGVFGAEGDKANGEVPLRPSPLELFLAAELEDAGVFSLGDTPAVAHVMPRTGCLRLTCTKLLVARAEIIRLRRVETAFNRALFCDRRLGFNPAGGIDACYRFSASVEASVAAQATWRPAGAVVGATSEWDVRRAISEGLEEFQLPYRLEADWQVNAQAGIVGFCVAAQPASAMATRVWLEDAGRTVEATGSMKKRAASHLACREALLLAFHVFDRCDGIGQVWVRVDNELDPLRPCVLWAKLAREDVCALDPAALGDPVAALERLGATLCWDGCSLLPVEPGFSLNDEALSPRWRAEEPERSLRVLPDWAQASLGAATVADLSRDAAGRRRATASDLAAGLGGSCEASVSLLLERMDGIDDLEERDALARLVEGLVGGSVDVADAQEQAQAVANADFVSDAMGRAASRIREGDGNGAIAEAKEALGLAGRWVAEGSRCFFNYVERSLYNRLGRPEGPVPLAPASHLAAHLFLASALGAKGDAEGALLHALSAAELNPFDQSARLEAASCYARLGDRPMAIAACCDQLEAAYRTDCAAKTYLFLATLARAESDLELACACLRKAAGLGSLFGAVAARELAALEGAAGVRPVADDELGAVLASRGVPDAPSAAVRSALREGARAAVEAGVFPVAQELAAAAGMLDGDEVLLGMRLSLQDRDTL